MAPTKQKRKKKRRTRKQQLHLRVAMFVFAVALLGLIFGIVHKVKQSETKEVTADASWTITEKKYISERPELDVELIPQNEYSRPGIALEKVNGIVVHYTANPGTTAKQNRDYFAGLAKSHQTKASSHFIIGLEGEIVQCIPCKEISYASNQRNSDTISIECCIPDDTGKFNDATYQSLLQLTAWLIGRYDLEIGDVIRHYDVTGKNCPKYFVEHEDAWEQFLDDVAMYISENGVDKK